MHCYRTKSLTSQESWHWHWAAGTGELLRSSCHVPLFTPLTSQLCCMCPSCHKQASPGRGPPIGPDTTSFAHHISSWPSRQAEPTVTVTCLKTHPRDPEVGGFQTSNQYSMLVDQLGRHGGLCMYLQSSHLHLKLKRIQATIFLGPVLDPVCWRAGRE